ncbi:MAG: hypothetical protein ABI165_18260 [Bryobacteraceae bacterium]
MTAQFGLTGEQELKIEPLLHGEESVTKPLLKFTSLSQEERQRIMLAVRRQIRGLLTEGQQKGMDAEVASVSTTSGGKKAGGKKSAGKKTVEPTPGIPGEENLSQAIVAYAALNPEERKTMLLTVKQAARNDSALQLTADRQKQLDTEIKDLSK